MYSEFVKKAAGTALICMLLPGGSHLRARTNQDGEAAIIAVYGDAAGQTNPPPGWDFQWNAGGEIGQAADYLAMQTIPMPAGRRAAFCRGVPDGDAAPRADRPSHGWNGDVLAVRDRDGVARYAIASYTLQDTPAGEVWIHNGNLLNRHFNAGGILAIYLNDTRLGALPVKRDRLPMLFQQRLGNLKKGDTIHVAVGPGAQSDKTGGRLRFTIAAYPAGQQPGPPVNILAPAITAAEPQRKADGSYDLYAGKHQAQCDALLRRQPELVLLGDSITARWPADLLEENFGPYRPANLGIGGDWIQNVLWRVLNGVLDRVRVKVIVLLIGTNNLSNGFTPEETTQGIAGLIQALQQKAPQSKILLLGILPRGPAVHETANDSIRQTNARLALLADGEKVVFLDVGERLAESDGSIAAAVMPDKLHPALPGYIRWMDAMRPTLNTLLNQAAE